MVHLVLFSDRQLLHPDWLECLSLSADRSAALDMGSGMDYHVRLAAVDLEIGKLKEGHRRREEKTGEGYIYKTS